MAFTLRKYQSEAVEAGVDFLLGSQKGNGILVQPTGSGKSLVIANIAKRLNGKVVVFQPSKELLEQNVGKYLSYGEQCEVYSASAGRKKIAKVTFATIGSVVNKPHLFKEFSYCIVDECHLVSPDKNSMYQKFFAELNLKVLGLTATPIRNKRYSFPDPHTKCCMLDRMRPKFFSKYLYVTQIKEMVDAGYFAETSYHSFDFDSGTLRTNSTGGAYTEQSIDSAFQKNDTIEKVVRVYNGLVRKGVVKHVLIFTDSVAHAEILAERIGCKMVSGTTKKKERSSVLSDFKKGVTKAVVNVGVLTTGFDFPELDCLINARPTMSISLYYQIVGRAVRPHATKEKAHIIDMVGNFKKFGRVEDFVFENKGNGWMLHNGKKILTNVDVREIDDALDEANLPAGMVIGFGKHKGTALSKVPQGYLMYVYENFERKPWSENVFEYVEKNLLIEKES